MRVWIFLLLSLAGGSVHACPTGSGIEFISCTTPVKTEILALAQDELAPPIETSDMMVTGTYSSGDRFGIEGLAIVDGTQVSARFQGWDGLLVVSPNGVANIYDVENVVIDSHRYNLRVPTDREAFVITARETALSVIQSHLLVKNGVVDVRDQPGQPRFRRRILFITDDGDFGLYDTGDAVTLFDAATQIRAAVDANMAFNLDMGAYDFCVKGAQECGWLGREDTGILTNVLRFRF